MFKTKSNLHETDEDSNSVLIPFYKGYNKALDDSFQSFKDRIDFYKKYQYQILEFMKDYQTDFQSFMTDVLDWSGDSLYYPDEVYLQHECHHDWIKWLFEYSFGDIK